MPYFDLYRYTEFPIYLRAELRQRRRTKGVAHTRLARWAGVSASYLCNLKAGIRVSSEARISRMAAALGHDNLGRRYAVHLSLLARAETEVERTNCHRVLSRLRAEALDPTPPDPDRPLSGERPALTLAEERLPALLPAMASLLKAGAPWASGLFPHGACWPSPRADLMRRAMAGVPPQAQASLDAAHPVDRPALVEGLGLCRLALPHMDLEDRQIQMSMAALPEDEGPPLAAALGRALDQLPRCTGTPPPGARLIWFSAQVLRLCDPLPPTPRTDAWVLPGQGPAKLGAVVTALLTAPTPAAFVADHIAARSAARPDYTYTMFARLADCSANYVGDLVLGSTTLKTRFVEGVARAMGLGPLETELLYLRAAMDEADGPLVRGELQRRVADLLALSATPPGVPTTTAATYSAVHGAIRELALCPAFTPDASGLARRLGRPTAQVEQALRDLLQTRLLIPDDAGRLRPGAVHLTTGPRFAALDPGLAVDHLLQAAQHSVTSATATLLSRAELGWVEAHAWRTVLMEAQGAMHTLDAAALRTQTTRTAALDTLYAWQVQAVPWTTPP